jgi:molybdate transport system substrate-binding protein
VYKKPAIFAAGFQDSVRGDSGGTVKLLKSLTIIALLVSISGVAHAQNEVTLLAPGPMRRSMDKIIANYQMKTGMMIKVTYGTGLSTRQSVAKGEQLDVSLILPPYWAAVASGNVDRSTQTTVAGFIMAVAVPKGAPKPDISSPEAVKKSMMAAKSVGYVDPDFGSAGEGATEAIEKLKVNDEIAGKSLVPNGGGPVQQGLTKGDLAFGMLYMSDMQPNSEKFDIIGPLPAKLVAPTPIVGFVSTKAKDPAAAKAFLQYLISPEAQTILKADGYAPHS